MLGNGEFSLEYLFVPMIVTPRIKSKQLSNRRKSLGLAQSVQKNLSMKTDLKPSNENKLTQFEITRPDGLTIKFQAPMAELKNILI